MLAGCSSRLDKEEETKTRDVPSYQLKAWSELHADPYQISERALRAYAYAAAAMDKAMPACKIGWSTLAGIGKVSSDNGSAGGASLAPDGTVSPAQRDLDQANPPKTPPLADTDAGKYDGNQLLDVTMGPMQILPSRWEQFATDADNNGKADPDNIDDASLTAARFLCAAGGDLSKSDGWTAAMNQFNATPGFAAKVHAIAAMYGR
ncbi:hypothetical protein GOEFS_039_00140 [Gordonia effusa NBRC 100432]|uniref:Transglycosylase SLT domain-containing protein n=1 Tax=Gordonia effusa NBRC 100432 TaxID=1077974 RepID=H0QY79_9ACTN|nr:hypothetical protein GOEFS_039_00140 [Gordonia effusa NBRC 100432]